MSKSGQRGQKLSDDLALVERVASWGGHERAGWAERVCTWAATAGQIVVVVALAVVALRIVGRADQIANDWTALLTLALAAIFAVMWLHLGPRMLTGLRRHFVIKRALKNLERRLDRVEAASQRRDDAPTS